MLYKPNFCCHCGERIDRVDWPLKASRRFCDVCQSEHLLFDWAATFMAGAMALVAVFAVGTAIRSRAAPPPPRPVEMAPKRTANANAAGTVASPGPARANANRPVPQPSPAVRSPVTAADTSAVCGAPTQKGTACTRRVREGGRCWQHR